MRAEAWIVVWTRNYDDGSNYPCSEEEFEEHLSYADAYREYKKLRVLLATGKNLRCPDRPPVDNIRLLAVSQIVPTQAEYEDIQMAIDERRKELDMKAKKEKEDSERRAAERERALYERLKAKFE